MTATQTIEQAIAEAKAKIAAIKEQASLQRQLNSLSNDKLLTAKANLEIAQEDIDKLKSFSDVCKGILEEIPVYDSRTKQNRKWNGSAAYSFDIPVQLLTNLCGNIQYANTAHKQLMLAAVPLPEILVVEINRVFNQNSRFSAVQDLMLVGSAGTTEEFTNVVNLAGDYLGIQFNLNQFNQDRLDQIEANSVVLAERRQAEHEQAKLLYQQSISL